jgi:preprotein translocase subunit SecA
MMRIGMKPGESIEHKMVSRSIEKAQEKVEKHNYEIRKHLLEYDDVLNQQRTVVYDYRRSILEGEEQLQGLIKDMITDIVHNLFAIYCSKAKVDEQGALAVFESLEKLTHISIVDFQKAGVSTEDSQTFEVKLIDYLIYMYEQYRTAFQNQEMLKEAEKWILLETVDKAWKNHLQNIDHLKEGIGLRGYGQKNPLIEYKKEAFSLFTDMMHQIKWDIVNSIFKMKPDSFSASSIHEIEQEREKELASVQMGGDGTGSREARTVRRGVPKVGRNDPCPCGSGKKYKKCCGRNG